MTIRLRQEDLTWKDVDDELILLDRRTWAYASINGIGALLWPLLVDGTTPEELTGALTSRFDVAAERAEADVTRFLASLEAHDLLERTA